MRINRLFGVILVALSTSCAYLPAFGTRTGLSSAAPVATLSPFPSPRPPTAAPATVPTVIGTPTPVPITAPTVIGRLPLSNLPGSGRAPYAMTSIGDKIYVVNRASDNVAVLRNDRVLAYIPVGRRPGAIAADPANRRVYVANDEDKTLTLIVDDVVTRTMGIGDPVGALLFTEKYLFAGLENKGAVLVLDPASLLTVATISIPKALGVLSLAGDPAHHRIYANLYQRIAVLDPVNWKFLSAFDAKESYLTLVADPYRETVLTNTYEPGTNSQYLVAYDPSGSERGRAQIGRDPRQAVMTADGTRVYVANSYSNDVSVVDPRSMMSLATIPAGLQPYALLLDENANRLYVTNYGSDNVDVIDTNANQVAATLPLAMLPTALLANESTGRVYVANASTGSVFALEGMRVVKEISVGHHPIDLAADVPSGQVFVANATAGTLSIIRESDFSVRTTQPITRALTTVAVDTAGSRVFAADVVLDLKTLAPVDRLVLHGYDPGWTIAPDWIRVNPHNRRVYVIAWNGTPGSNSRSVTYSVDGQTLQQRGVLASYGNISALAVDPESDRVFLAGTQPLSLKHELSVFDANDSKLVVLPLPARTTGMVYNPQTHHLFLAHASTDPRFGDATPVPGGDVVEIFDTDSFGLVGRLVVDSPGKMTRLGNLIYVAGQQDGSITVIQDANVPTPPSPTPTITPSPYPTYPPLTPTH